jgi:hypothetical protein
MKPDRAGLVPLLGETTVTRSLTSFDVAMCCLPIVAFLSIMSLV